MEIDSESFRELISKPMGISNNFMAKKTKS